MVVVTKSIAPLDPQLAERLTTTLGPPKTHTIERDGDRDLALNAWVIGRGEVRATPDAAKVERGTTVEIFLTDNGRLLASRAAWTRRPGVAEAVSRYASMPEAMPEALYRWLLNDGKGKLGPASKEAWTQACRNVPPMAALAVENETGGNTGAVLLRLRRSDEVIRWVHANLDGKKIPALPDEKRVQLAAACWHIAIDHQMAVVVLVHETLHASALALMRPTIEAYVRGLWLRYAATDQELDKAGRDQFANDFFGKIVADLEMPGRFDHGALSHLKGETWRRLCSYTHTGYQQIGARLTTSGLGYDYEESEILGALALVDSIALMAVIELAGLAKDTRLRLRALDELRRSG
jgi:hypothetical protein